MKNKSEKLQTVLNDDLVDLLKSIHKWDSLDNGEIFCSNCKSPITLKNLQAIIPISSNDYDFLCNNTNCIILYKGSED